jgi:hypothetical protein
MSINPDLPGGAGHWDLLSKATSRPQLHTSTLQTFGDRRRVEAVPLAEHTDGVALVVEAGDLDELLGGLSHRVRSPWDLGPS